MKSYCGNPRPRKFFDMNSKIYSAIIIIVAILISISCNKPPVISGPMSGSSSGSGPGAGGGSGTGGGGINRPPTADAGPDQSVIIQIPNVTAFLNGSASHDSSGVPIQFFWRQIAGPSNCDPSQPTQALCMIYSPNIPGVYSFELKVWNSSGSDFDTTDVTVSIPYYCGANRPEVPVSLTFLSNFPGQVQNAEIIAAGNKLIIPAWFSNATNTFGNNVYMYDLIGQNWTTIQTSQARVGVTTIAAGNKVFFAGGVSSWEYNYTPTSTVDIYDITTNTWSISNLSEARGYCTAVVSGNKIFFAGGLKSNNALSNKVDIYDLESNSWSSAVLPGGARQVGAAVAVQNKVLFCGGLTIYEDPTGWGLTFTTPSPVIDIYDNNTGQWSAGSMQVNKESFAATSVNGKVYFAGGIINNNISFLVEELNVNTMNSSGSCLHQPMVSYGSKGAVVKNDMIIFFDNSPFAGIAINRFDIYNWQTNNWSIGVLPADIANNYNARAIVAVNNEIYTMIDNKLYKMNL